MSKNLDQLIQEVKDAARPFYFKENGESFDDVHDWNHMKRVYGACVEILEHEPAANKGEILIGAILHDIGRSKSGSKPHAEFSYELAEPLMVQFESDFKELGMDLEKVLLMVRYHSVAHICPEAKIAEALEFNILTDADKIDMFGASGVLRQPIAQARIQEKVVYWAIDRFVAESDPNQFEFRSEGGRKIGQKYKDYLKKFVDDINLQRQKFESKFDN